jgi:hypothetical protein
MVELVQELEKLPWSPQLAIAEDVWRDRSQRIAVAKKALNRLRPWERKDGYFGDRPLAHVKRRAYASDNMVDPREPGEGSGDGRS